MLRSALTLIGGIGAAQLIQLVATPIIAKGYGTTAYGEYSQFYAVSAFLSILIYFRADQWVLGSKRKTTALKNYRAGLQLLLLAALLAQAVILVVDQFVSLRLLKYSPIAAFALAYFNHAGILLIKRHKELEFSGSHVLRSILLTALQAGPLLLPGAASLFAGFFLCIGRILADVLSAFCRIGIKTNSMVKLDYWKRYVRATVRGSFVLTAQNLLNSMSQQLPFLIIPLIYSYDVLGNYSVAFLIAASPITLIGSPIRNLALRDFSQTDGNYHKQLMRYFWPLAAVSLTGAILWVALGKSLLSLFFDGAWQSVATYAPLLYMSVGFGLIAAPAQALLIAKNQQAVMLRNEIYSLVTRLALVVAVAVANISSVEFIFLFALIGAFFNIRLIRATFVLAKTHNA